MIALVTPGGVLAQVQSQAKPDLLAEVTALMNTGQYAAAAALIKPAIDSFQDDPTAQVFLWNTLGLASDASADYDQAEASYRAAIALLRDRMRERDPELLTPVANLAGLYLQYGQRGKAERLLGQLDSLAPHWHDIPSINAARLYGLSAMLELSRGHYEQAEPLMGRALEMAVGLKAMPPEDLVALVSNFAVLNRLTGRREQALEGARRANAIASSDASIGSAQHALILLNLVLVEYQSGLAQEARQHFQEGMELAQHSVAPVHPVMADVLLTAATYLQEAGRKREARQFLKQANSIRAAINHDTSLGKTVDYKSLR